MYLNLYISLKAYINLKQFINDNKDFKTFNNF